MPGSVTLRQDTFRLYTTKYDAACSITIHSNRLGTRQSVQLTSATRSPSIRRRDGRAAPSRWETRLPQRDGAALSASVCLSVCLIPHSNWRMERLCRKPKTDTMEAHHTGNPWNCQRSKGRSARSLGRLMLSQTMHLYEARREFPLRKCESESIFHSIINKTIRRSGITIF